MENIVQTEIEKIREAQCWSLENMEKHTGEYRDVTEIASEVHMSTMYTYYVDSKGEYWYTSRKIS